MYFIFLRSIPLNSYSSAFSWPVIKDTSFTCRCEFGSCRMHFPQTAALTHIHETRRFSSHLPWEVFYYNNQPALPSYLCKWHFTIRIHRIVAQEEERRCKRQSKEAGL